MNVTRRAAHYSARAECLAGQRGVNPSDSQRLAQTMRVSPSHWRRLSRYAFWTALACVLDFPG